jgi:GNAT superfamily N-acetyltransferase
VDPIDYNFAHSLACFVGTSKTGEVLESPDVILTNSRAPVAEFNQGFLKRPGYKLDRALRRAIEFYRASGLPFRLNLRADETAAAAELEARGFRRVEHVPAMVLSPIRETAPTDGLTLRQIEDAKTLADFQATAFESFGFPVELAPVALTEELMRLPHVTSFVGYVDETPACCSLLLITGDVAGIYWVGSVERYRRRGFGAAVTAHAVSVAAAQRCRLVTLQASKMGEPVYRRLGFETVYQYLRFDSA